VGHHVSSSASRAPGRQLNPQLTRLAEVNNSNIKCYGRTWYKMYTAMKALVGGISQSAYFERWRSEVQIVGVKI